MAETSFTDLFAPVTGLRDDDVLESWRWLTGPDCQPLLLTAMGDLFVIRPPRFPHQEAVFFLDVVRGRLDQVASSYAELRELLIMPERVQEWLLPDLVATLRQNGVTLEAGQCYSPKLPPVLGGEMEPSNLKACDWRVHLDLMGQIHKQGKDLPAGTIICGFEIRP